MSNVADLFPESPRVLYGKAPLTQVICQLRFPPVLAIEAHLPSEFQEHVRNAFPLFERATPFPPHAQIPPEIAQMILAQVGTTSYRFLTEDRSTFITLESASVAISTSTYSRWENFIQCIDLALQGLAAIYRPSFFSRLGLRYSDAIIRSRIGLTGVKWSELINKDVLGLAGRSNFEEHVEALQKTIHMRNSDRSGGLILQQALYGEEGAETQFAIDFDFYHDQRASVNDAKAILERLHGRAGSAFRWCISERLHAALEPSRI